MNDFLTKPVEARDLARVIADAATGRLTAAASA
jgi:hypothetical protein